MIRVSSSPKLLFVGYVHCHWMGKVDSDDKSKGVLWVLGHLMWDATITEVDVVLDLLL